MGTPPARLLLVRHAESEWNAVRRWQGQGDPPLSPRGRAQAESLGERLAAAGVAVLVASDLRRAAETATVAGRVLGVAPRLDPRLRELDVGTWTGLTRDAIGRREPETLARLDARDFAVRPGGGETLAELAARASRALDDWAVRHPGAAVAVVTHSGLVRTLFPGVRLGNTDWHEARWDGSHSPPELGGSREPMRSR